MWDDMIHDGRSRQLALGLTENAKRMPSKVCSPSLAPSAVVAPEGRAAALSVAALCDVFFAVNLPLFAEPRAAGVAAGAFWFHGHIILRLLYTNMLADRVCFR